MDKQMCLESASYCLRNSFWNVLKPIAECCPSNLATTTEHLTAQTTTADDVLAAYLELHQSAIISVERFSFLIAGILMLIATVILVLGTCYMTCFNDDKFNYSAVPQIDFMDEGVRDFESLLHTLAEIGHPLHKTVKHLVAEFEEFHLLKQKTPVSDL